MRWLAPHARRIVIAIVVGSAAMAAGAIVAVWISGSLGPVERKHSRTMVIR